MPGHYSSHGTFVSFDGVDIGYLDGFDWDAKAGQLVERTHVGSRVVGVGANARVVKQYDCKSVEPATLSFTFFGPPSFSPDDAGAKAVIEFETPGGTISGPAILMSFSHSGRSGQWAKGTATFQLTGELG
jgi:hypothetical protein